MNLSRSFLTVIQRMSLLLLNYYLLLTVLSLAPSILILMTSFARIVIVLSFTRTALATNQMPPNQVIIGLALFLTFFIMAPTFQEVNEQALQPLFDEEIGLEEAYERAAIPFKEFMAKHTRQKDLELFLEYNQAERPESIEDIPANDACSSICT